MCKWPRCVWSLATRSTILNGSQRLSNCIVCSHAFNIANGHGDNALVIGEFAHNGGWLVAALLMRQRIAVQCAYALHFASIDGLLVEFLAQLECDGRIFECRLCGERIIIAFLVQEHGRADRIADFAQNQANTCENTGKRMKKTDISSMTLKCLI